MEETVKFISGIVHCPCKKEGSQHAHIHRVKDLPKMPSKNLNVNDGRYIQICFVFECGHTRTDHYRFYKGTTYCETQHIFDARDCPFQVVAPRRFFNKIEMEDSKAEDGSSI